MGGGARNFFKSQGKIQGERYIRELAPHFARCFALLSSGAYTGGEAQNFSKSHCPYVGRKVYMMWRLAVLRSFKSPSNIFLHIFNLFTHIPYSYFSYIFLHIIFLIILNIFYIFLHICHIFLMFSTYSWQWNIAKFFKNQFSGWGEKCTCKFWKEVPCGAKYEKHVKTSFQCTVANNVFRAVYEWLKHNR